MKVYTTRAALLTVACFLYSLSWAQNQMVEVSYDRIVILHFDSPIHKAWVGNEDMVSPKSEGDKLILQSKKENDDFIDNNLQVQTLDGSFFIFALKFNNRPAKEFFHFTNAQAVYKGKSLIQTDTVKNVNPLASFDSKDEELLNIKALCRQVEAKSTEPTGLASEERRMQFLVGGIYVKDNLLFFKVLIANESNIPYDIDFIRFVVEAENKKIKRTASQEDGKKVKYILGEDTKRIVKGKINTMVFVFDKFTIDKKEKLYIEFWELKGDRNIRLAVPNKSILAAKAL